VKALRYVVLGIVGSLLGTFVAVSIAPDESSVDQGWAYAWVGLAAGFTLGVLAARAIGRRGTKGGGRRTAA